MKKEWNILLVEDNDGDKRLIIEMLKDQSDMNFNISFSDNLNDAINKIKNNSFDSILLDLGLPDSSGIETFEKIYKLFPDFNAIIILTGLNDNEIGFKAVNKGAQDYLIKGQVDTQKLIKSIIYSYERNVLNNELKKELQARTEAERKIISLNRVLMVLRNINQLIVKITDKKKLIKSVCHNLITTGEFFHVATRFDGDHTLDYRLTRNNKDFSDNKVINELKCDLHKKVIDTKNKVIVNTLRTRLIKYNVPNKYLQYAGSLTVFPINSRKHALGTLTIVSDKENFFDKNEVSLLKEVCEDISFAFSALEEAEEKRIADEELEFNRKAAESLYSLSLKTEIPEQDVIKLAMEMAVELTSSKIGYLHFMNEDQESIELVAWSTEALKGCTATTDDHYPLSQAGVWADCARTKQAVIHNDYLNLPEKKGMPEGHTVVKRHMSIPVIDKGKVVIIAGVGNKEKPYREIEAKHLQLLMDELWKIIAKNRILNDLKTTGERLDIIARRTNSVMYQRPKDSYVFDYVHPAIELLTGYDKNEINRIGFKNIIKKTENMISGILDTNNHFPDTLGEKVNENLPVDYLIETKQGELKWINDRSYPITDETGNITGSIGTLMDVSLFKEAELEIISQKIKSDQLFSNSPSAIVQTDLTGIILKVNESFGRIFGFKESEVIGQKIDDLIVPSYMKEEGLNYYKNVNDKLILTDIAKRQRKDGTTIYTSIAKVPINISGTPVGFFTMYEDLTKQKHAEDNLLKAMDKAEESDKLKTAFLHNISHEIRTPMNAITGFVALLREPYLSEDTRLEFIETIDQSCNHLLAIIGDIVEIANIEAGLISITKNDTEINSTLKTVADTAQLKLNDTGKQIKLITLLHDTPFSLHTDNTKLYQILSNLVNNAIKFTESGEIEIGYFLENEYVKFYVSDTGIGISQENMHKIFDRFFQVEFGETRRYEGTGLGLSISKAYVELLGGKIWVHSELGKKTVFYFTLPNESVGHKMERIMN